MGKEGDLWDDSALINAFDEAISKYKKMHGKGCKENPSPCAIDVKTSSSNVPAVSDSFLDNNSSPETHNQMNDNGSHAIPDVGEIESLETAKETEVVDLEASKEHPLECQNDSTFQNMDKYNQLYKQYYEIEEERQKILQKMQAFSNWNSSYEPYPSEAPVSGMQWAPSSVTQEHQLSTSQVPCGTMVVSCCPCACQCSMASCSTVACPLSCISASNLSVDSMKDIGRQPVVEDADIVKTAMGAAERVMSTLNDSKEKNKLNNGAEQSATCGTDFSTVLNAWYSAGFYTGKYLTEQSFAKKQHDSV